MEQTINGWLFVTQVYMIPQFYQLAYGYSATRAGSLLLPLTVVQSECRAWPLTDLQQSDERFQLPRRRSAAYSSPGQAGIARCVPVRLPEHPAR